MNGLIILIIKYNYIYFNRDFFEAVMAQGGKRVTAMQELRIQFLLGEINNYYNTKSNK